MRREQTRQFSLHHGSSVCEEPRAAAAQEQANCTRPPRVLGRRSWSRRPEEAGLQESGISPM